LEEGISQLLKTRIREKLFSTLMDGYIRTKQHISNARITPSNPLKTRAVQSNEIESYSVIKWNVFAQIKSNHT
jgi:hypothetical protein